MSPRHGRAKRSGADKSTDDLHATMYLERRFHASDRLVERVFDRRINASPEGFPIDVL
jgi:hypothetical protein